MLCSLVNAHFDIERYAKLFRDKRAQYMQAKQCLIEAEGPYIAARNAYIASTSVLTNMPHNFTDTHRRRLFLRHAIDSNGTPPGDGDNGDNGDNNNHGEGNASQALTSAEQQEQYYNDYINSRQHWLQCKHDVAILEMPYLSAREAYIVAANSYSASLLPVGADHLWAPVYSGHI